MKYIILFLCFGLISCSNTLPYVDSYSGIAGGPSLQRSTPNKVAICFNKNHNDMQTLQTLANTECAKTSKKAKLDRIAPFSCSLITPSTAYFDCY
ncbi:MAG: hypothetical protein IKV03_06455 [Alphaproteobacteria bacterium]|nr:hypothetical protein [Alphaproteobacteria bacterium]